MIKCYLFVKMNANGYEAREQKKGLQNYSAGPDQSEFVF